jgi:uncharacterized protein
MKEIISQLIDDFHDRKFPKGITPRDKKLPAIQGKADVIMGMRRTGKTFFCYQKIEELISEGISPEKILYLNFEDDRLLEFKVNDFQLILDVYFGKFPPNRNSKCHFFFDEIQRINQWEVFIRRLLDTENVHIYITGSSSKLLSSEIATSLRGRSFATEIFPFSFLEFLQHHNLFKKPPIKFSTHNISVLRKAAEDYLNTGGFPEVQKLDRNIRTEVLQGYIDSVLMKDVIERHKVGNVIALKHLVHHIMNTPCGKFSVNRFYNTLKSMSVKCAKNSLYEYLDHLADAYLFYKVPIHSRSEKSRIVNPVKVYTIDTGLLNAMTFRNSENKGLLLENLVFINLRRNGYEVEYVNTPSGFETDFFARHKISGDVKLIQVCWDMTNKKTFNRELRGLQKAMEAFSINTGTIVTWDDEKPIDNGIETIPIWKWLLM